MKQLHFSVGQLGPMKIWTTPFWPAWSPFGDAGNKIWQDRQPSGPGQSCDSASWHLSIYGHQWWRESQSIASLGSQLFLVVQTHRTNYWPWDGNFIVSWMLGTTASPPSLAYILQSCHGTTQTISTVRETWGPGRSNFFPLRGAWIATCTSSSLKLLFEHPCHHAEDTIWAVRSTRRFGQSNLIWPCSGWAATCTQSQSIWVTQKPCFHASNTIQPVMSTWGPAGGNFLLLRSGQPAICNPSSSI